MDAKGEKQNAEKQNSAMVPGEYVWDTWTQIWVTVVYGAQQGGYTTIRYKSGEVVSVRTDHLERVN
jgi:hypothetical protein